MGIALGIDFSWNFVDFRKQEGAKLASKIDKHMIQKGIEKMMANKRHLQASWKRLGAVLADLGGGIYRTARVRGDPGPHVLPQLTVFTVWTVFTVKTVYWAQGT